MNSIARHIATLGGIGYLPAPGTIASGVTALLYYFFVAQCPWWYQLPVWLIVSLISIPLSQQAAQQLGNKDPSQVVIDELSGMWLALVFVPQNIIYVVIIFGLFRVLDIAKPGPVGWADRKLGGGMGIMLDDIIAGAICAPIGFILSYIAL